MIFFIITRTMVLSSSAESSASRSMAATSLFLLTTCFITPSPLVSLRSSAQSCSSRMCDDPGDLAERAADAIDGASRNVEDVSKKAASAFDALEAKAAARLKALGAVEPPPAPPPMARSEFSISSSTSEKKAAAEELLRLMRRKDTGELEVEHAAAIKAARSMAVQWLEAGLSKRAEEELLRVAPFCSYKTDAGANFHLQLAAILVKQGNRESEAKRMRTRVMQDAESSSIRWQAEQLLQRDSGGSSVRSDSGPANQELSRLWKMPEW